MNKRSALKGLNIRISYSNPIKERGFTTLVWAPDLCEGLLGALISVCMRYRVHKMMACLEVPGTGTQSTIMSILSPKSTNFSHWVTPTAAIPSY